MPRPPEALDGLLELRELEEARASAAARAAAAGVRAAETRVVEAERTLEARRAERARRLAEQAGSGALRAGEAQSARQFLGRLDGELGRLGVALAGARRALDEARAGQKLADAAETAAARAREAVTRLIARRAARAKQEHDRQEELRAEEQAEAVWSGKEED